MTTELTTIARPDTAALIFVPGGTGDVVSRIEDEAREAQRKLAAARAQKAREEQIAAEAAAKSSVLGCSTNGLD